MYRKFIKRPLDFICALLAMILFSPVFILTAILVRTKLGKPVIFRQDRPELQGKIFRMYKFRTMTNHCDNNGKLLPDKERLTKLGKILRSTSIDELPELFNILKEDMSIVGVRGIIETTKKSIDFSRVVKVNSIPL